MKTFNLAAILFLLPFLTFAQTESKIPSLNAKGTGKMTVSPDWVTTYLHVTSRGMDYNKVVQDLNSKVSKLEKQLVMSGFKKDDLKTSSYTVNKNIVWADGRSIDSGYIAQQSFTLEFDNNNQKIAALVKGLSEGKVDANFNFSFGLSEKKKEEVRTQLIQKAVKDATSLANSIAAASAVKLKRIISINYGQPQFEPPVPMYERAAMKMDNSSEFAGFNVKDIEMSDTIFITWEIE